jgi:hypothetical protein
MSESSTWSLSLRFRHQKAAYTSPLPFSPHSATCTAHRFLFDFINQMIFDEERWCASRFWQFCARLKKKEAKTPVLLHFAHLFQRSDSATCIFSYNQATRFTKHSIFSISSLCVETRIIRAWRPPSRKWWLKSSLKGHWSSGHVISEVFLKTS